MEHQQAAAATMKIRARFFASLRERMGRDEDQVSVNRGATVLQVWEQVSGGEPLPENTLIALNMEYVKADTPVQDNDEVAFFPPVTGG